MFLSVDLVGSTRFKARFYQPDSKAERPSPNPAWVDQIRHFYRDFPERLGRIYEKLEKPPAFTDRHGAPQVWKTVGDEIILCCRLTSIEHLALCVRAFITTLEEYGAYLDSVGKLLDVKGYGWVAAFPSPNVTVSVFDEEKQSLPLLEDWINELPNENDELDADQFPHKFDFLGKEIDSGFRSGKYCSADRLSLSLELAWLLTKLNDQGHAKGLDFAYSGRQELKGVLGDRPYPIFYIDVERSQTRKNVRATERIVNGNNTSPSTMDIHNFLDSFIIDENIEYPILAVNQDEQTVPNFPKSYGEFRLRWLSIAEELSQRSKSEKEAAGAAEEGQSNDFDNAIVKAVDELIARLNASR